MIPKPGTQNYIAGLDRGVGGGGWVAPKSYESAKKFSFENSFGRYGGGRGLFGEKRSTKLFNTDSTYLRIFNDGVVSNDRVFSGGFAGRAHPGIASMETLHRYKQYNAMMMYKKYGRCYHGYCGHGIYHRRHCFGGCVGNSFCDFGICRCHNGYYAYHGSCWNDDMSTWEQDEVLENDHHQQLLGKSKTPFQTCNATSDCHLIDMNLICSDESKICQCREHMKWHKDELECQVYIDVDCSIFEKSFSPELESSSDSVLNPRWDDCEDDPKEAIKFGYDYNMNATMLECATVRTDINVAWNQKTSEYYSCYKGGYVKFCPRTCKACQDKWSAEYEGFDISTVQLPSYNLTENDDGSLELNITNIEPEESLSTSYLTKLDLKNTKPMDVKKEFCLELQAISTKYTEPKRIREYLREVSSCYIVYIR